MFTNQPLANHSRVETVSRTDRPGGRFESSKRGKDEPKGKSDGKVHAAGFAFNVLVDSKFPSQLVQTGSFERDGVAQKSLEIFGPFWIILDRDRFQDPFPQLSYRLWDDFVLILQSF